MLEKSRPGILPGSAARLVGLGLAGGSEVLAAFQEQGAPKQIPIYNYVNIININIYMRYIYICIYTCVYVGIYFGAKHTMFLLGIWALGDDPC